jgi:hypothetical protein
VTGADPKPVVWALNCTLEPTPTDGLVGLIVMLWASRLPACGKKAQRNTASFRQVFFMKKIL